MSGTRRAAGLVMAELAAALVVVVVLAATLLIAAGESRRQSSLGDNFANLKQFAAATGAYGADNDDRVWSFSWRAGIDYGFGGVAASDLQAAANQAVHIMRQRGNRPDINVITGWFPHAQYSHLVLLDYLEVWQPQRFVAGPQDRLRILWQTSIVPNPNGYFQLVPNVERPPGTGNAEKRWSYSSSYELPPAFMSPDARSLSPPQQTVSQGPTHSTYFVPANVPLGNRRLTEVRHPAHKVMLFENYQRHFGPRIAYFAYAEARVAMMLADGSASVRRTGDAGRGFRPDSPTFPSYTTFNYQPAGWQPQTLTGQLSQTVAGYFRWTRSGLRGRDFGGPEVPWVD